MGQNGSGNDGKKAGDHNSQTAGGTLDLSHLYRPGGAGGVALVPMARP